MSVPTFNEILYITVALFLALPMHEFAHAFVAHKLGDNTAKDMGRLSLNPFHHLDWVGSIMMYVAHFGWAKPVPVNPANFRKNKKLGMLMVALAGPFSNIVMAFLSMLCLGITLKLVLLNVIPTVPGLAYSLGKAALDMFSMLVQINIVLAVFNMIPVPPLDGSRILSAFIPDRYMAKMFKVEQFMSIAFLLIVFILPMVTGKPSIITGFISSVFTLIAAGMKWIVFSILAIPL